jgi:hypothetical protein
MEVTRIGGYDVVGDALSEGSRGCIVRRDWKAVISILGPIYRPSSPGRHLTVRPLHVHPSIIIWDSI